MSNRVQTMKGVNKMNRTNRTTKECTRCKECNKTGMGILVDVLLLILKTGDDDLIKKIKNIIMENKIKPTRKIKRGYLRLIS